MHSKFKVKLYFTVNNITISSAAEKNSYGVFVARNYTKNLGLHVKCSMLCQILTKLLISLHTFHKSPQYQIPRKTFQ
jgi:hypothetical protein